MEKHSTRVSVLQYFAFTGSVLGALFVALATLFLGVLLMRQRPPQTEDLLVYGIHRMATVAVISNIVAVVSLGLLGQYVRLRTWLLLTLATFWALVLSAVA